jgi:hypothetical protein
MSKQKDNQSLEDYLKGKSGLSRHYHSRSTEEPPVRLDTAIMSAAKKAVENNKPASFPSSTRWYIPLSLAVVVVISFSVVFTIYDQAGQQIFSKQTELKSEKPAAMLEDRMEHDAGEPAVILQDKIISIDSLEMKKETGSRSTPSFRKDTTPDASDLSQEIAPPATPAPGSVAMPAERRMTESSESTFSADSSVTTDTLSQEQWLEIINQLWFDGDKEGAYRGLKNFLADYPDYPLDELKKVLPQDLDLSVITGSRDTTTEDIE